MNEARTSSLCAAGAPIQDSSFHVNYYKLLKKIHITLHHSKFCSKRIWTVTIRIDIMKNLQ